MNALRLAPILFSLFAAPAFCQDQVRDPSLPDGFYAGSVVLEYSLFGKAASGAKDLKKLHDEGQWIALARGVIEQKSLGYDVYYYYLAVSAKNLGYEIAAKAFAERALSSRHKCAERANSLFYDTCQGIDVQRSIKALFFGPNRVVYDFPTPETLDRLAQLTKSPIGIGEIKLGDRMEQVLLQDPSRSARVTSSTSRGERLNDEVEVPGAEFLSANISTPLSSKPLPARLTFHNGRLFELELGLGDGDLGRSRLQTVKNQIEGRFGMPTKTLEEMTTVRCVFGNANSYLLNNGKNAYSWSQKLQDDWFVVVELVDLAVGVCPYRSTESRIETRTATYRVDVKKLAESTTKPLF